MKSYFITGLTGFVGSHMADYILKKDSDATIFALKRWRSKPDNIRHLIGHKRISFIEGDLLDTSSLIEAIKVSKPDYVLHFAAQSFPGSSFKTPVTTLQTNVIGTTNLLEMLNRSKQWYGIDPIILSVSSSEVYGNPNSDEIPISEKNPLRAANPYSISKVGHDLMSQYYFKAYGLKVIITRMFSHEGSRRGKEFALSSFARQIVENEIRTPKSPPFTIYVGNLDSVRTYSHIDDAVRAYWLCIKKGQIGDVYNIGGSYTTTVKEALNDLKKKSTIDFDDFIEVVDKKRVRPTDITLQVPDCSKFEKQTGWEPRKKFDDICEDLLNYWRNRLSKRLD